MGLYISYLVSRGVLIGADVHLFVCLGSLFRFELIFFLIWMVFERVWKLWVE